MSLKALKLAVWKKAKGNELIAKGTHHYRDVSKDIFKVTGYSVGPDTIRNFLEGRNNPRKSLLDIYATYVLDGTSEDRKTFQEFEASLQQKPILDRLGDVLREGKKEFLVILFFLVIIVVLVSSIIIKASLNSDPLLSQVISESSAISSPDKDSLNQFAPDKILVRDILSKFSFDDKRVVNLTEGQRMMEWLGIRRMTHYTGGAEDQLSGYLDTGCKLTLWIGIYGKRDTYGVRCSCNEANIADFKPYIFEILKPKETEEWVYQFDDRSLDNLSSQAWELFPPAIDTTAFHALNKKGQRYLTLQTSLGDSWLENKDYEPLIRNILTHPLSCGTCCEIKVKIFDFNPYQPYQQAGFFLFYGDEQYPSLRYTFASNNVENRVQAVRREGKYINGDVIPPVSYRKRYGVNKILYRDKGSPYLEQYVDSIILKLTIDSGEYFFAFKTDEDEYIPVASKDIDLGTPHTIGLAAFQGRPDIPFPVLPVAEILKAKFEYVIINDCN